MSVLPRLRVLKLQSLIVAERRHAIASDFSPRKTGKINLSRGATAWIASLKNMPSLRGCEFLGLAFPWRDRAVRSTGFSRNFGNSIRSIPPKGGTTNTLYKNSQPLRDSRGYFHIIAPQPAIWRCQDFDLRINSLIRFSIFPGPVIG